MQPLQGKAYRDDRTFLVVQSPDLKFPPGKRGARISLQMLYDLDDAPFGQLRFWVYLLHSIGTTA